MDTTALARHAAILLGHDTITEITPLHGGDLSKILRAGFADGTRVVIKTGTAPQKEAAMLRALRDAGSPVPDLLAVDDTILVMTELPGKNGCTHAWRSLGDILARQHTSSRQTHYGWHEDFAFGDLTIPNEWQDDWPTFWRDCRLVPHLQTLPTSIARELERLANTLHDRLPAHPPAALLHGDLWTGNLLSEHQSITGLIDPACFYGDACAEFAILTLFARPPEEFWEHYGGRPEDYAQRIALYRLWPALIHYRLFGSSYLPLVQALLAESLH